MPGIILKEVMMDPIIKLSDVSIHYHTRVNQDACHGINLEIKQGERVGIVGESGCGKTTLLKSINGLVREEAAIYEGDIQFQNISLRSMQSDELFEIRTHQIAMVFQDCMNAFNPTKRIGKQLIELLMHVHPLTKKAAMQEALSVLESIGFADAEKIMRSFPYQMSGGMLQRVSLAMVFLIKPQVILADEPSSALDVVSAQFILSMLHQFVDEHQITLVLSSHQLKLVSAVCQRVLVMYQGHIVEEGPTQDIFASPLHPYTRKLVCAASYLDQTSCCQDEGVTLKPERMPNGCVYASLCPKRSEKCLHSQPPLVRGESGRKVACFYVA